MKKQLDVISFGCKKFGLTKFELDLGICIVNAVNSIKNNVLSFYKISFYELLPGATIIIPIIK